MDENNTQVEYTVAGNMGNMIGQLSLQIANLQVTIRHQNDEITNYKAQNAELKHQLEKLRGRDAQHDKRSISITGKQDKHQS